MIYPANFSTQLTQFFAKHLHIQRRTAITTTARLVGEEVIERLRIHQRQRISCLLFIFIFGECGVTGLANILSSFSKLEISVGDFKIHHHHPKVSNSPRQRLCLCSQSTVDCPVQLPALPVKKIANCTSTIQHCAVKRDQHMPSLCFAPASVSP